jgi:hypothetical protein
MVVDMALEPLHHEWPAGRHVIAVQYEADGGCEAACRGLDDRVTGGLGGWGARR